MYWKEQLKQYEYNRDWDAAIKLMRTTIDDATDNMDAYLFMCYLLMDIIVNKTHDSNKRDYYAGLLKKYFFESYCKYSNNPEYLFYIGFIASMSEWYFGIEWDKVESILKEATYLDSKNPLYEWGYCCILDQRADVDTEIKYSLSMCILESNALMEKIAQKGLLGKYLKEFILSMYESTKALL